MADKNRSDGTLLTFQELKDFIASKMKLSHIYQPLLIKTLVDSGGVSTLRQLATIFLSQDESQILYYEKTLKAMPVRVLQSHGVVKRDGELVTLSVKKLTLQEKAEIRKVCEQRMQEYIAVRGWGIWDYRLLDDSPVPDVLAYRILKEAGGRCALCGATKDDRPLHIDHILPRSKGGKTAYENLQVLCVKCNCTKRDRDNVDFRNLVGADRDEECLFCGKAGSPTVLHENDHALCMEDGFPVTYGHSLILPKRHFPDYFNITSHEQQAVHDLLRIRRNDLLEKDSSILGFNVGVNAGTVAGQTVPHCHVHLIPRREGDTANPRGGVRGVIPGKMDYGNG